VQQFTLYSLTFLQTSLFNRAIRERINSYALVRVINFDQVSRLSQI
jgi:hypothetical protein